MSKDFKREQCYEAERHFVHGTLLAEVQSFDSLVAQTREIEATVAWKERYGTPLRLTYNEGRQSFASYGTNEISYRLVGTNRSTVCHEMAHILTPMDEGHGHAWRTAFVWVVRLAYGDQWADGLYAAFRSSNLTVDLWGCDSAPVFPPAMFAATVGGPTFARKSEPARGPIAL